MLALSPAERLALQRDGSMLPVAVTPYYMSLLDPANPQQPLRRTVVPTQAELLRTPGEADDPLGEDGHSPVPGLVHRYPDRVLFLVHDFCSTYCRYCTRSRLVGHGEYSSEARSSWRRRIDYIRRTPAVRDVLLSGGDPLTLADDRLDWILTRAAADPPRRDRPHRHQGARGAAPADHARSCAGCCASTIRCWMSLHFIHPDECTPESATACARLADAGIPLGSQTVLLKGVNDDVETMKRPDARACS